MNDTYRGESEECSAFYISGWEVIRWWGNVVGVVSRTSGLKNPFAHSIRIAPNGRGAGFEILHNL